MKNVFWKKVLVRTCAYFTVAITAITLIMLLANSASANNIFEISFSVLRALMFAIFCFAFAFANTFYSIDKMKEAFRLIAHLLITGLGFFVCIYLPVSSEMEASGAPLPPQNTVVIIAFFAVVYFIAYGIFKLISKLVKKNRESKETYTPVYKNFKK